MKGNTNRLALKAGSWYIVSNFALKAIAILSTPIFTRLLSPEEFGLAYTYTSWLAIITIVGTLDIYSCIQIGKRDFKDSEMDKFISSILTASTISLFILYLVIKILVLTKVLFIGLPSILVDIMFLEVLFFNAFTILQTKHKAFFKYKQFVLLSATIAILSPISAVILIYIMESNLYYGKIIGNLIPKLLISILVFVWIIKKGKSFYNKKYWLYALSISIPLIPHHLSGIILNHSDKIMINKFTGVSEVGIYSLAYSYAAILSVAWVSFNSAWLPWFQNKMDENNIADIKKYAKPYLIVFSCIFLIMLVIGPEALKVFGPEEYWEGIWVIPPVLFGMFMQFIYSLFVNIQYYNRKTMYIAYGTMVAAVINIILNIILIPRYGYIAAAYTTLIGYFILFIMHYFISQKWEKRDIYGKSFIFFWVLSMMLVTILISFLYGNIVLRYALLFFTLVFMFFKYKYFKKSMLKFIK